MLCRCIRTCFTAEHQLVKAGEEIESVSCPPHFEPVEAVEAPESEVKTEVKAEIPPKSLKPRAKRKKN